METDPVSQTLSAVSENFCRRECRTMDEAQNPVIPTVIHHRQNPYEDLFLKEYSKNRDTI
jgi:hypothetical protein